MTNHAGKITISTGTYTDTCTYESDLIANQAKRPEIRNMMEYANRRALTTLLTSGVVTPYGINNDEKTKMAEVSTKGTAIGNNEYQFAVMGRLEKASVIVKQIGATTADGRFTLLMNDRHLFDGMNVVFNGARFQARVDGAPQGSPQGGYLYNFWNPVGDLFSWTTHVAGQAGTKTCMGSYTSYTEKSQKSDGTSKFADKFVNHTTIQRSTVEITGTAASSVLWYTYTNADGASVKGWMFEELAQQQATFVMQNERQKWFGQSSMKNTDGTYRSTPPTAANGKFLVQGDGLEEQIGGGNYLEGSGVNGEWTVDDLKQMMKRLEKKSDKISGLRWVLVTGTDGYANFQEQCRLLGIAQNTTIFNSVPQSGQAGGAIVDAGYNFASFNVAGNQLICVKHPMLDDEEMFTERGDDGNTLMSSYAFVFNLGEGNKKNVEVLYKAANGVNRDNVSAKFNGMTGSSEMSISEEDAMKFALLKEDLINIYNTQEAGILAKGR